MPDSDAPSGPRPGDGVDAGGAPAGGDDLSTLDPLPRTGTAAPAARLPYATAREPVGTRIGPPARTDRGPYGDSPPTEEPPAAGPDRFGPGEDGGPSVSASEQPPPDGRWAGGSAASEAARATRAGQAVGSARPGQQDGGYRPGEPIRRPSSADTGPGPGFAPAPGRPSEPVGPELAAAARRAARGALLLAITGVGLTILFFPIGGVLDVAAIVFGVRARRLARRARTSGAAGGFAVGLGIPAVLLSIVFAALTAVFWTEGRTYVSCASTAITTTTQDRCTAQLRTDLQRRVDAWTR